ncbi:MAG: hypothetical protein GX442_06440 [Candidatus Riflebacteria bacterium]|nr:hypothetical protein [Candidatus Riflebacteria bacterium]
MTFEYTHSPSLASRTSLVLENTSPDTASHAVWFEGIQLERTVLPDQIRPTTYSPREKPISPHQQMGLPGEKFYFEW